MRKLLPVAAALLLTMTALLPFRATASEAIASGGQPIALAISQPLASVVAWRTSSPAMHEPGVLLVVGGGLMGLGSFLRRATGSRDDDPPDV